MAELLQKKFTCALCRGTGVQPRFLQSRCLACRGKGKVEFDGPAFTCSSCKGKGRSLGALGLACIPCKGVGAVGSKEEKIDTVAERFGEITKRLQETRKETEKKTKEIEKRLKPIKPFIKEISALGGAAFGGKKEILWFKKLRDQVKEGWKFIWEK